MAAKAWHTTPLLPRLGGLSCWPTLLIAALAMVATLPGRTNGLGVITESLLKDFALDRVDLATMNLWATLWGAVFCVPWGWLLDRCSAHAVLAGTLFALAGVVGCMSRLPGDGTATWLFVLILLTRGLGQSALSVVSLTMLGKASRGSGLLIGAYSFVVALGFSQAFAVMRHASTVLQSDWRQLWAGIGWGLAAFGAAVVVWRVTMPTWQHSAIREGEPSELRSPPGEINSDSANGHTLGQALATPVFWVFALGTSYYGMVAAGVGLFNESILKERGFDRDVFLTIASFTPMVALASNLATGWLAEQWPLPRLLATAMALLMAALVFFPYVASIYQVYFYATAMGVVGGMITTLFFAIWSRAFGLAHLGKIQGAAQMLTVFASALGPLFLAIGQRSTGSYVSAFQYGSVIAGALGVAAWLSPMPGEVHNAAQVADSNCCAIPSPFAGEGQGGG